MRSAAIKRKTALRPVNRKRKRESDARNFGDEAKVVRAMPCAASPRAIARGIAGPPPDTVRCRGRVQAAHVTARGMGGVKGGRFDLAPLCDAHHREAGEAGTSQRADFEKRYGIDLRAEADRIAVEHPEPLGIRALAQVWAAELAIAHARETEAEAALVRDRGMLDDYEREALLGWVRRRMERLYPETKEHIDLSYYIAIDVGAFGLDLFDSGTEKLALALCEAAGWPS